MVLEAFITTCSDPMAETTCVVFQLLFTGLAIGTTACFWWILREFRTAKRDRRADIMRVGGRIDGLDAFRKDTSKTLTDIQIDVAKTSVSVEAINKSFGEVARLNRIVINRMLNKNRTEPSDE